MSVTNQMEGSAVRIAFEGCGHGTLHAIYASVRESCRVKGWSGVDAVIIGGDFQAVRNQYDLNVTAMPKKYRKMADFHEYYSGVRKAPYLTLFIGGNHEASNHLFELYYGGWVAPNIYYLGAANVVRLGPLRIAGLTGIWKGYDYRKPHFERLPYNDEEMTSIYHVRELDVRKLLSVRSQVDIGLSHDWPQGVEMHGDYKWLFSKKTGFAADSRNGKLGNVAARQCLEYLRPPMWFSAHLHTRFTAIVQHGRQERQGQMPANIQPTRSAASFQNAKVENITTPPLAKGGSSVSAWQDFSRTVQKIEAEEQAAYIREYQARTEAGISSPHSKYAETWNEVSTGDSLERTVISATKTDFGGNKDAFHMATQLDGCSYSRLSKRMRTEDYDSVPKDSLPDTTITTDSAPATSTDIHTAPKQSFENPDTIEISMSSDEETTVVAKQNSVGMISARITEGEDKEPSGSGSMSTSGAKAVENPHSIDIDISSDEDESAVGVPRQDKAGLTGQNLGSAEQSEGMPPAQSEMSTGPEVDPVGTKSFGPGLPGRDAPETHKNDDVSEDARAALAALSSTFSHSDKIQSSPALPPPEAISNKTTSFLALGKCEPFQEFLQLLAIEPIDRSNLPSRPVKLSYDPEWLAITRVFAPELHLSGSSSDKVPQHRGDTWYAEQVAKEREWVEEHIVRPGLLEVPENFQHTAPVYDPNLEIGDEQPTEVTNPQTTAFCTLVGIENKFDISEEDRAFRMQQGPKPVSQSYAAYNSRPRGRGGHHGGNRGGNRGRGRGRGRW